MRFLLLTSGLVLGISGAAFAQYTGPSADDNSTRGGAFTANTIQSILDDPKDDQDIVLEGVLIRQVGREMYVLSDGTAEINVEIGRASCRERVSSVV